MLPPSDDFNSSEVEYVDPPSLFHHCANTSFYPIVWTRGASLESVASQVARVASKDLQAVKWDPAILLLLRLMVQLLAV